MRNAFGLFDRDGDGSINAKVVGHCSMFPSIKTLPVFQELGAVMKTMGMAPSEDSLAVRFA